MHDCSQEQKFAPARNERRLHNDQSDRHSAVDVVKGENMSGILTFTVDDVLKKIVKHARDATLRYACYAELYDPQCRKDGKAPEGDRFPQADDVDEEKIPPGLWLVADRGVYLMSPGKPGLTAPSGEGSLVSYAVECNPADDHCYDSKTSIMGGDDGVDKIGLEVFEEAIRTGAVAVIIEVTNDSLKISIA